MKKLKKSSALLLIVSFLLSIFSFSAFAAGNTITVNICPRLLSEQQQSDKIGSDGDPGGSSISGAKFSLYKLNNTPDKPKADKSYVCERVDNPNESSQNPNESSQNVFPFNKTKNGHEIEIAGKKYKYYSDNDPYKTVTTGEDGIATVTFEDGNSGWYIAVMQDSGEKTCLPTFICVNNLSNNEKLTVYPKVVNMADDSNLPGIKKCILGTNETRYVSKHCDLNGGLIDYQVDVNIPKINGNYKASREVDYGTDLNVKYPVFSVTDNALSNNDIVENLADQSYNNGDKVEVTVVDRDDNVLATLDPHSRSHQGDYTLNISGKSLTVDFKRGQEGFSPKVIKTLFQNRNNENPRLRIRFSVKIRNDVVKCLVNRIKTQNSSSSVGKFLGLLNSKHDKRGEISIGELGLNNPLQEEFRNLLRIENTAMLDVQKGQNRQTVNSNKVICQFGFLSLRKTNHNGDTLDGAQFSLYKANMEGDARNIADDSVGDRNNLVGYGEVDPITKYRYFVFSAGQSQSIAKEEVSRLSIENLTQKAESDATKPVTFYLYETQAPAGYEMMRKPIAVSLSGGFNYQEVVNYPEIKMPFTGGTGTILFTAVGILLIGSGALLYMNFRRKKSAE